MKEVIGIIAAILLIKSSTTENQTATNKIIEKFVNSSSRTVTFVSIDESITNTWMLINQYLLIPKHVLQLNSSSLTNCSNYANVDFFENEITLTKFQSNCKLEDMLYLIEFSDFLIFTPSKFIASILKCIVQPMSRYYIIVTTMPTLKTSSITHMLNRTWIDNGALKIFILLYDKVITFNPFHRNDDGSFGKLNTFVVSFESSATGFKNLNGYPLRVELFPATYTFAKVKGVMTSVDDFYGPDADVAQTMKEVLNATLFLIKNDGAKFGFKSPNGTFTGALKSIIDRRSDVAFVTFFIKDYETRSLEFSAPVYSDDLCLVVKKAERIPQFMMPLITFDRSLWIALGVFWILGVTIWSIIRLLNNKIHTTIEDKRIEFNLPSHIAKMSAAAQYVQIFIDSLILVVNAPLRRFPRVQSERIYTATVCMLSLNIIAIFQSGLATCYLHPMYYKNIETLEQFADSQLRIVIKYPAMMTDIFPEDSSTLFHTLYSRMVLVPNPDLNVINVTKQMKMAGVTRKTTLKVQKEESFVHIVSECPRTYHLSYIVPKHWVLSSELDMIILLLKQAGLISKWIGDVDFRIKLETSRLHPPEPNQRSLQVDDLMLSIMILGVGSAVGLLLFFIELCYMKHEYKAFKYLP